MTENWLFWAPTPDASIEHALDIAGVKSGDHLLDLGCGDGRVLEAAAERGATATGYEADALRAAMARERLAPLKGAVRVEVADLHTAPLDADVIFTFLSPAILFRLRDRLAAMPPATRIVTYGYGIIGWEADEISGGCFLYTLPPKPTDSAFYEGWHEAATVIGGPPGRTVLASLLFGAHAGEVELEASPGLRPVADFDLGANYCDADCNIPIDIKLTTGKLGSTHVGSVRVQGSDMLLVVVASGEAMQRKHVRLEDLTELRKDLAEVQAGKRDPATLLHQPVSGDKAS